MFASRSSVSIVLPLAAACSIALLAGRTYASSGSDEEPSAVQAKKHTEELNKGKSHEDATTAAQPPQTSDKAASREKKHAAEMSKGKSHEDAATAAAGDEDAAMATAKARKHAAEMNKGKSHDDATNAAEK